MFDEKKACPICGHPDRFANRLNFATAEKLLDLTLNLMASETRCCLNCEKPIADLDHYWEKETGEVFCCNCYVLFAQEELLRNQQEINCFLDEVRQSEPTNCG